MRMYALKSVKAGKFEIREDDETVTVPAVITKEGVYDYDSFSPPNKKTFSSLLPRDNSYRLKTLPFHTVSQGFDGENRIQK